MRTRWIFVIAAGLMAAAMRLVVPSTVVDAVAIGYLLGATVAFGRTRWGIDDLQPAPSRARLTGGLSPR